MKTMKTVRRIALTTAGVALAFGAPAAAFAATPAPAEDDGIVADIPDEGPDLGKMEQSYKVTAKWGEGKVVTDTSTGSEEGGAGDGEPISPEPNEDAEADTSGTDEASADADAAEGAKDAEAAQADAKGSDEAAASAEGDKGTEADAAAGSDAEGEAGVDSDSAKADASSADGAVPTK